MPRFLVVLFHVLSAASLVTACESAAPAFRGVGTRTTHDGPSAAEPARTVAAEPSREGWNEAQIDWQPYETGLAQARRSDRPVCIVFSAEWCPHCRGYSHVFEDPRVVEASRGFVMIRVDSDAQRDVASRYAIDGGYVPRTYFLEDDGTAMADVVARTARFHYFFDEHDPASLLAGMASAQRHHGS